jgi:pimeloyl-ACP methyl ester carboxylesterase
MTIFSLLLGLCLAGQNPGDASATIKVETGMAKVAEPVLYYEAAGQGTPLVLLHGGQLDSRMWDDQFLLYARAFRVIRYDIRSYGRSRMPTQSYSDVEDLKGLLDSLGIKQAHLVGLSLGGRIATDFALLYPDRVLSLVLAGPGLGGFEWSESDRGEQITMFRTLRDQGPEAVVELWLKDDYMIPAMENPRTAGRVRELALANAKSWLKHPAFGREIDPPAANRLADIKAPTLLIVGDRDVPDIQKIVRKMEQEIPGARKVAIRGAGHMVNMEKPDEFNYATLSFLRELK